MFPLSMQLSTTMEQWCPCGYLWFWYIFLNHLSKWNELFSNSMGYLTFLNFASGLFYGHSNLVCYLLHYMWWCHWGLWSIGRGITFLLDCVTISFPHKLILISSRYERLECYGPGSNRYLVHLTRIWSLLIKQGEEGFPCRKDLQRLNKIDFL